ncbi:MAG: 23S rRNA (uracil(1939)-C(5))-methyltransferase RlmD [Oscillospiraceae bacterium]|nr:23S rRNA (uracil(1939)-C(5))-methyltransferase RlmD [Oscillospiraceae bacterium]
MKKNECQRAGSARPAEGSSGAKAPGVKKNDVFTAQIQSLSNDGAGVAKIDGVTVFVPFTAVGDTAEIKAVKITKSVIFGKLLRVISPSPDRTDVDCEAFPLCGGCDFRHISYSAELRAKESFVRDAFTRIGKLTPEFLPIIADNGCTARYRNKAQYPLTKIADARRGEGHAARVVAGFYAPRSHRIIPHRDCLLHPDEFNELRHFIVDYISANRLSVYDEATHSGVIRHICIRKGHYSGEINICLVVRRKIPELRKLANIIAAEFPAVTGVVMNVNPDKTNVIYGESDHVLHGNADITDTMCGIDVRISPRSFYQVNTSMAERLYAIAADFAQSDNAVVLDLYCGIGTIGLSMAHRAKTIIGVERVAPSVTNANANAQRNGITNARFILGDAADIPDDLSPDAVILDPARKGCERAVLERVARLNPARIVMVSCDPATAARDCARLGELGYATDCVAAVDLFPRTRHVECVAKLHKRQPIQCENFV